MHGATIKIKELPSIFSIEEFQGTPKGNKYLLVGGAQLKVKGKRIGLCKKCIIYTTKGNLIGSQSPSLPK